MTARTITTAAELDALPVEHVLLEASGRYRYGSGTFERCWVRPVPPYITGTDERVWEVLVHVSSAPLSLVHSEDLYLPVTVLHDPSAPAVPVVSDAAVEAAARAMYFEDCGMAPSAEVMAGEDYDSRFREYARAALSAALPLLGAAPSVEHIARTLAETTALTGADAHLIVQAAQAMSAPSATRDEVADALRVAHADEIGASPDIPTWDEMPQRWRVDWLGKADALLARFTITPRTDR